MILFATCLMMACGNDDDLGNQKDDIDIDDPDVVSNSIIIENAIKNTGNPPAPTTGPDTPVLNENSSEEDYGAVAGRSFYLNPDVTSGEVAGVYLQIKGASEYYDIPTNTGSTTGRFGKHKSNSRFSKIARTNESNPIEIEIPDNLEPGEFCAVYCVYDEEGQVSNTVEVCIEIIEFGGEGSDFFAGQTWELFSTSETYDGMTEVELVGEDDIDTYDTQIFCGNDVFENMTVTEIFRTNYLYLTLATNGAYELTSEEYSKYLDYENSNCQNLAYTEETDTYEETGVWTYDDVSKTMTVVTEYVDEYDGETYTDIFKLQVALIDEQLVMTQSDDEGTYKITFNKKN